MSATGQTAPGAEDRRGVLTSPPRAVAPAAALAPETVEPLPFARIPAESFPSVCFEAPPEMFPIRSQDGVPVIEMAGRSAAEAPSAQNSSTAAYLLQVGRGASF